MTVLTNLRSALNKRAAYNRTKHELESVNANISVEDLGFHPSDAARLARKAVYGY